MTGPGASGLGLLITGPGAHPTLVGLVAGDWTFAARPLFANIPRDKTCPPRAGEEPASMSEKFRTGAFPLGVTPWRKV